MKTHLGGGILMKRKSALIKTYALSAFTRNYPVELIDGCTYEFLAQFSFKILKIMVAQIKDLFKLQQLNSVT